MVSYILSKIRQLWTYEPAVTAWAINGGIAAVVAFLIHLSPGQTAAITTITTALAVIVTAIKARPVSVSIVTGGLTTIASAIEMFGLHLSTTTIGAITTIASGILGLLFRQNLTPKASLGERSVQ